MIKAVSGDILLTNTNFIAHGVAANDPMNQGLALQLRENYPSMHKDFHYWCHINHPKTGEAWEWCAADGIKIVNLLTQEGGHDKGSKPGKDTLPNVNHAIRELKKTIEKENVKSCALPRLAIGVGGLSWDDVKPIIDKQLGDLDCDVYVYTKYVPNEKANEN